MYFILSTIFTRQLATLATMSAHVTVAVDQHAGKDNDEASQLIAAFDRLPAGQRSAFLQSLPLYCRTDEDLTTLNTAVRSCYQSLNTWMAMPVELLSKIFSLLECTSAVAASQVCRHWHASFDEATWKSVYLNTAAPFRSTYKLESCFASWEELCKLTARATRQGLARQNLMELDVTTVDVNRIAQHASTQATYMVGLGSSRTSMNLHTWKLHHGRNEYKLERCSYPSSGKERIWMSAVCQLSAELILYGTYTGYLCLVDQERRQLFQEQISFGKISSLLSLALLPRKGSSRASPTEWLVFVALQEEFGVMRLTILGTTISLKQIARAASDAHPPPFDATCFLTSGDLFHICLVNARLARTFSFTQNALDAERSVDLSQLTCNASEEEFIAEDVHTKCFVRLNATSNLCTWYRMEDHHPFFRLDVNWTGWTPLPLFTASLAPGIILGYCDRVFLLLRKTGTCILLPEVARTDRIEYLHHLTSRSIALYGERKVYVWSL
eukprot:m.103110 g.103110  ORF g.103110 m.103110 type:complete len:498 (-) comp15031_c1_seq1:192-1685(-)